MRSALIGVSTLAVLLAIGLAIMGVRDRFMRADLAAARSLALRTESQLLKATGASPASPSSASSDGQARSLRSVFASINEEARNLNYQLGEARQSLAESRAQMTRETEQTEALLKKVESLQAVPAVKPSAPEVRSDDADASLARAREEMRKAIAAQHLAEEAAAEAQAAARRALNVSAPQTSASTR